MKKVYVVEGLDRLGKDTLIGGILNVGGFYQELHFGKPKLLDIYSSAALDGIPEGRQQHYIYQYQSFLNAMMMIRSGARIIFNRSWIGEAVYSPIYRQFSGDYVFKLETDFNIESADIRLILLTEDFAASSHFEDDGESLGPVSKRAEEQTRFIQAFERSTICDKRIICVTDRISGGFRDKHEILKEAIY